MQRTVGHFEGFDFDGFWTGSADEPAPSDELIAQVEAEIGYRLPDAYVELARMHNGGSVELPCFPMAEPTDWSDDHIRITRLFAIGRTATYSLLGPLGATFMRDEWEYPDFCVAFADTPSGGHDLVMLDYRACGAQGEPTVVHVAEDDDYLVTPVAPDFATFIRGLVSEDEFDTSEADRAADLAKVREGTLSPVLRRALDVAGLPDGEPGIRALAERIVQAKGYFALHADPDSWLMYDAVFWLFSHLTTVTSFDDFLQAGYVGMVAGGGDRHGFGTGGYARKFVDDWWAARHAAGEIHVTDDGHRFTDAYADHVAGRLQQIVRG